MSDPVWTYANPENTIVFRNWPNGMSESCSINAVEFQMWVEKGNSPLPYVPPPPAPDPTVEEKLASVGLTISDLKAALGL